MSRSRAAAARRRERRRQARRLPPGASPGTLSIDPESPQPVVTVIAYGPDRCDEHRGTDAALAPAGDAPVTWVDVAGLGDAATLERIAAAFALHPLAMEDVTHLHQRPKVETYDDRLFLVMQMPHRADGFELEQISIFLGPGFVVSFQERAGDCFDQVRARLRRQDSRLRRSGPDYLAYALLDALVDHFFPILEDYGERIDLLEDEVIQNRDGSIVGRLMDMKRDLLRMRRAVWPLRESLSILMSSEVSMFAPEVRTFLRDCRDHVVQIIDIVETYRETCSSLVEIHLSVQSQKLNEVMKVLTIISTLFIPLGFIAGLYGMNFDTDKSPWNMPELHWYLGYPFALVLMGASAVGLLSFLWRKGWLGRE